MLYARVIQDWKSDKEEQKWKENKIFLIIIKAIRRITSGTYSGGRFTQK